MENGSEALMLTCLMEIVFCLISVIVKKTRKKWQGNLWNIRGIDRCSCNCFGLFFCKLERAAKCRHTTRNDFDNCDRSCIRQRIRKRCWWNIEKVCWQQTQNERFLSIIKEYINIRMNF